MAARPHCKETKNGENGTISKRIHCAMIFKFQLKLHRSQIFQTKYLFYLVLSILLYDQESLISGSGCGLHVTQKLEKEGLFSNKESYEL